ncbi:MAG TPA: dihydrofolate reductase family protein [Longimicrobium sp.]|nr:dihydrofolate reductase family protein [Longimicrobium sp.]
MRKVVLSEMVSLDGYFKGPGEGWEALDWHRGDDAEWEAYSIDTVSAADTLLFGRETYVGFQEYWPAQTTELARLLNGIEKVVFSTMLDGVSWTGARIVRDGAAGEIARLKQLPGRDIVVFGSADFAATLIANGLVDEFRLAYTPVVLGGGVPLFKPGQERLNLRLAGTRTFASGVVLLTFKHEAGAR